MTYIPSGGRGFTTLAERLRRGSGSSASPQEREASAWQEQRSGDPTLQVSAAQAAVALVQNRERAERELRRLEAQGVTGGADYERLAQIATYGQERHVNWFLRALNWLDRPGMLVRYAIADLFDIGEGEQITGEAYGDVLLGRTDSLLRRYGAEVVGEDARMSGSQLLELGGWDQASGFGGRLLRGVASVGTEIATDPLSYLTGGAGGLNRTARLSQFSRTVERARPAVREMVQAGRVAAGAGRSERFVRELAEDALRLRPQLEREVRDEMAVALGMRGADDLVEGMHLLVDKSRVDDLATDLALRRFVDRGGPRVAARDFAHPDLRSFSTWRETPAFLRGGVRVAPAPVLWALKRGVVVPGTRGAGKWVSRHLFGRAGTVAGEAFEQGSKIMFAPGRGTWLRGLVETSPWFKAWRQVAEHSDARSYLRGVMSGELPASAIINMDAQIAERLAKAGLQEEADQVAGHVVAMAATARRAGLSEEQWDRLLAALHGELVAGLRGVQTLGDAEQAVGGLLRQHLPNLPGQVADVLRQQTVAFMFNGRRMLERAFAKAVRAGVLDRHAHLDDYIPLVAKQMSMLVDLGEMGVDVGAAWRKAVARDPTLKNLDWAPAYMEELLAATPLRGVKGGVLGESAHARQRMFGGTFTLLDAGGGSTVLVRPGASTAELAEATMRAGAASLAGAGAASFRPTADLNRALGAIIAEFPSLHPGFWLPKGFAEQVDGHTLYRLFDDNPITVYTAYLTDMNRAIVERVTFDYLEEAGVLAREAPKYLLEKTGATLARISNGRLHDRFVGELAGDVARFQAKADRNLKLAVEPQTIRVGSHRLELPGHWPPEQVERARQLLTVDALHGEREQFVRQSEGRLAADLRRRGVPAEAAEALSTAATAPLVDRLRREGREGAAWAAAFQLEQVARALRIGRADDETLLAAARQVGEALDGNRRRIADLTARVDAAWHPRTRRTTTSTVVSGEAMRSLARQVSDSTLPALVERLRPLPEAAGLAERLIRVAQAVSGGPSDLIVAEQVKAARRSLLDALRYSALPGTAEIVGGAAGWLSDDGLRAMLASAADQLAFLGWTMLPAHQRGWVVGLASSQRVSAGLRSLLGLPDSTEIVWGRAVLEDGAEGVVPMLKATVKSREGLTRSQVLKRLADRGVSVRQARRELLAHQTGGSPLSPAVAALDDEAQATLLAIPDEGVSLLADLADEIELGRVMRRRLDQPDLEVHGGVLAEDFAEAEPDEWLARFEAARAVPLGERLAADTPAGSFAGLRQADDRAGRLVRRTGDLVGGADPQRLRRSRLFLTGDGRTGFAVDEDGVLWGLFNVGEPGAGGAAVLRARREGALRLVTPDDNGLPSLFGRMGFVETGRSPFDRRMAGRSWREGLGRPDTVSMALAPADLAAALRRETEIAAERALADTLMEAGEKAARTGRWDDVARLLDTPQARRILAQHPQKRDLLREHLAAQRVLADPNLAPPLKELVKDRSRLLAGATDRQTAHLALANLEAEARRLSYEELTGGMRERLDLVRVFGRKLAELQSALAAGGQYADNPDLYRKMMADVLGAAKDAGYNRFVREVEKEMPHLGVYGARARPGEVLIRNYALSGEIAEYASAKPHVALFVENMMAHLQRLNTPVGLRFLAHQARSAVGWWKTMATVVRPTFHIRNLIGGVFNGMIAGVGAKDYLWVRDRWIRIRHLTTRQADRLSLEDAIGKVARNEAERAEMTDMVRMGVANSSFAIADRPGMTRPLGSTPLRHLVNPLSQEGFLAKTGGQVMTTLEDFMRAACFHRWYKEGGATVARDMVNAVHFDYANLTKFESWVKNVVPFFVWTRRNIPLWMQALVERPDLIQTYSHLMHGFDDQADLQAPFDLPIPGMYGNALTIGTGMMFNGDTPFWARAILSPDLPINDLAKIENPLSMQSWLNFLSSTLGPQVTLPFAIQRAEEMGGSVNAPAPLNAVLVGLNHLGVWGNVDPETGTARIPRWVRTLGELVVPGWREYAGPWETDPGRRQALGLPAQRGTADMDVLRAVGATLAKGVGLKTVTPTMAYSEALSARDDLTALIYELQKRGILPSS